MRELFLLGAVSLLAVATSAPALAITYVTEGTLSLTEDRGLGDAIGFEGARIRIEVDADLSAEPNFPTVSEPVGSGPNIGRFGIGETRAYFTNRAGGLSDAEISFRELALGVLQTINETQDADRLIVPGQSSSSIESSIDGLFVGVPSITATLAQPYTEFTSFGNNSPIGRVPDLVLFDLVGLKAGTLRVSRTDPSTNVVLFSEYSLSDLSLTSIPEPSTAIALGIGLALLSWPRRKSQRMSVPLASTAVLFSISPSFSASAFDPDHCWNLAACPGSPNAITDQNPTFQTFLNTDTQPIGHCATVWVIHYNDAIVRPLSVQPVNFPGNPEFSTRALPPTPAVLTNPNAECLSCDTDLTVIWEDLFDNGFQLPVANPNAEVRVTWELIATPPAQIILDGVDAAESVFNASDQCLTGFITQDTFGTLVTVPEPGLLAGLMPGILFLLLLLPASSSRAQTPPIDPDLNQDGFVDEADNDEFLTCYLNGDLRADFDEDGLLTPNDLQLFADALAELEEE